MGMNILVLRRQRKKKDDNNDHDDSHIEIVYGEKGLEQIMKESDYVVIAAPLTAAMIGIGHSFIALIILSYNLC